MSRLDAFLAALEPRYAANTRRKLRTIASGVLQHAVLTEAIPRNPVRDLDRIEESAGTRKAGPRGLTAAERSRLLGWLDGESDDPDVRRKQEVARAADLPDLVRFMLGTGLRVGEALAIRCCDVNLTGVPVATEDGSRLVPVVTMAGNVTWVKGKGLTRHGGKTDAALRVIPLPAFVVRLLRARLVEPLDPQWPVFPAAGGGRQPASARTAILLAQCRPVHSRSWPSPSAASGPEPSLSLDCSHRARPRASRTPRRPIGGP